jgi:hypothetical protein
MRKPCFASEQRIPPKFPEDAEWEKMRDQEARACVLKIVAFIKEQIADREYGKIEGLRESLWFIGNEFP